MDLISRNLFDRENHRALFWRLQVLGWGIMVIITLLVARGGPTFSRDIMIVGLFHVLFEFLVTSFVMRPLLRWTRQRGWAAFPSTLFLIVLSLVTGFADGAAAELFTSHWVADQEAMALYMATSSYRRSALLFIWGVLYLGIHYWLDTRDAYLRMARLEAEKRTAELRLLRAQVNPHFLFNALNSIQAEAEDPAKVLVLSQALAEYLRFSMSQDEGTQCLGEELEALEHYLQVEKIRFEERLEYRIDADARTRRSLAPAALVQPLLENAIKYGQRSSGAPLRVWIEARREQGELRVEVGNSGEWVEPSPDREGIGLSNLRRRLNLLYGSRAALETRQQDGAVRVTVRLPTEAQAVNKLEKGATS